MQDISMTQVSSSVVTCTHTIMIEDSECQSQSLIHITRGSRYYVFCGCMCVWGRGGRLPVPFMIYKFSIKVILDFFVGPTIVFAYVTLY